MLGRQCVSLFLCVGWLQSVSVWAVVCVCGLVGGERLCLMCLYVEKGCSILAMGVCVFVGVVLEQPDRPGVDLENIDRPGADR